jgi:imidazolonepropionase-like amidohydrolase
MVQNGMSPDRAIRSGTIEAAKLIGLAESIGSLEPGKLADLIVADGNPLDNVSVVRHKVQLVMKGGTIYKDNLER